LINPDTIRQIFDTVRIEDVIGEFVTLKKRGVNYVALCPFHNEKTPSFYVSPAKGIYKCFGCGKSGNAASFLMEHEHYSYPEALKYLAKKYSIDIIEDKQTPEQIKSQNEKESIYNVNDFACKYFSDNLFQKTEAKIGLTYLKERGFTEDTIKKFQLGYSIDKWNDFTENALNNGYNINFLKKSGLTIAEDSKQYDRFKGRVMFPIHNLSARILGFGGRILTKEKDKAKYINSPESDIYHKSKILYGLYFSKSEIIKQDNCYLVEGYTDVISLYQAGIENVVASSGTSLTTEQIRLIRRYTKNITILYDSDTAGTKAAFRGIDMIFEQGINVKVLLFPQGQDPDSFARNNSKEQVKNFIAQNATDFIIFKTNLLLKEIKNEPTKKTSFIRDILQSIALIPDAISRSIYIKECGNILKVQEQILMYELNKIRKQKFSKRIKTSDTDELQELVAEQETEEQTGIEKNSCEEQERRIIFLLLNYGNQEIVFEELNEDKKKIEIPVKVAKFITNEINTDNIKFENAAYQLIFDKYASEIKKNNIIDDKYFINDADEEISKLFIDIISNPYTSGKYTLSKNWEIKYKTIVETEDKKLKETVLHDVYQMKAKKIEKMILEIGEKIKDITNEEELTNLMQQQNALLTIREKVNLELSRIIIK
jgi:DNA primase